MASATTAVRAVGEMVTMQEDGATAAPDESPRKRVHKRGTSVEPNLGPAPGSRISSLFGRGSRASVGDSRGREQLMGAQV